MESTRRHHLDANRNARLLIVLPLPIGEVFAYGCDKPRTVEEARDVSRISRGLVQSIEEQSGTRSVAADSAVSGIFSSQVSASR
jgi:hypothetical protein